MTDDQTEIDFSEDIKDVIRLPWKPILTGSFLFGLLLSLASFLVGLPGIIGQAFVNYQDSGDLLSGEDPWMILFIFLLTILLITFSSTFLVIAFMLLNGSKTFQFLFLWSLVTLGYLILLLITLCVSAIPVLCLFGAVVEGSWGFGVGGIVMLYPAWKLLQGSYYSLRNLPGVVHWVYRTTAKMNADPIH